MSSPKINYPAQPTYGEGLADALEAQTNLLTGRGQFEKLRYDLGVGSEDFLKELLKRYEKPVREATAQMDTDVLRRTLLGQEQRVVQDPETGRFGIRGGEVATDDQGQAIEAGGGRYQLVKLKEAKKERGTYGRPDYQSASNAQYGIVDTKTGGFVQGMLFGGQDVFDRDDEVSEMSILADATKEMRKLQGIIDDAGGDANAVAESFTFTDPNTGEPLEEGQTVRTTTGMVDLLGDRRQLLGEDRTAGFDESGQFLGLSALTEDIGQAQLSRRRERDLADVERLAPRYKDVMDAFRDENLMNTIGEVGGTQDVFMRDMAEQRAGDEEQLGMAMDATAQPTDLGSVPALDPAPSTDPASIGVAGVAGDVGDAGPMGDAGDPFTARLAQAGTPQGAGLRETLTNEALLGLRDRLTPREEYQIAEAARARATMMGRTFDQSEAIREAQARVLEDNQRRMQNRAFAQNVLGQEAGTRFRELALRQQNQLDPFTAILGRPGTPTTGQASQILGQAGYGLESGPQYLNPTAGLGFIQQQATNAANMAIADQSARATAQAGMFRGLGSLAGGALGGAGAAGGFGTLFS
jgi:RNase P/RNase MRP subunit p29